MVLEKEVGLAGRYYNTLLCFPLGMFFSEIKPYIDKVFMKSDIIWFTGFFASIAIFAFFSQNRKEEGGAPDEV